MAVPTGVSVERWRRRLLLIVLFGAAGLAAELVLLDHHEDWRQWIPLVFLGGGTIAGGWLAIHPSRAAVRAFRTLSAACVPAGVLGVWFHFASNVEFERELHPHSGGLELVRESLGGAMPTLAPGAMVALGLLGMLAASGHPAASRSVDR